MWNLTMSSTNGSPQGRLPYSELMVVELSDRGGSMCPPADSHLSSLLKMD
jgi:hypothetical protein